MFWDYALLLAGSLVLVFANASQPRFLGVMLVLTAGFGMALLEYHLWVVPGSWYIFSVVYFALNLLALALSPAQLLLLLLLKPQSKPVTGIVVHYPKAGEDEEDIKVDIVAVHGLGSNPDWAWQHEETGVMWLKDLLPKEIPNARIMTFNHNSKWDIDASVKSVEACGQELLDTLNLHRRDEKRAIIFVGHSFGGIIIKKALVIAGQANIDPRYKLLKESTIGILFLGVPHNGSALTATGKLVSYATYWLGSSTELLEALEPGAKLLEELNNSFLSAYNNHFLVNFYERWKTKKWGIPLLLAVDEKSGSFVGRTRIGLEADHVGVNKFRSEEDNNYMLVRSEIKKMINTIQDYSREDLSECLKSLRFEGMGDRERGIRQNEESTFNWIWGNKQFIDWCEKDSGVFWVLGKPGSGKSTFSKYVFRGLAGRRQPRTAVACFFFNDRGVELAKSPQGLLQDLLYQILTQIPKLSIHIIPRYKSMKVTFGDDFKWPLDTLLEVLLELFASPTAKSVCIFIDAADECKQDSRKKFYEYIIRFCNACPNSRLKIFATSRPEPWLLQMMKTIETLETSIYKIELQGLNYDDIRAYVKGRLKRFPEEFRGLLEKELLSHADGVFLWAKLVLDDLEEKVVHGGTIFEIQQRLSWTPTELNELYSRMLGKLRPEYHNTAKHMLQWVLLAKRPLRLEEFRYATAIAQHKFSSHQDFEGSDSVEKPSDTESRVRGLSGGLLEVVESRDGRIVQLIHQSAREFLIEQKVMINSFEFQIIPTKGHAHLAAVCVSYLQFSEFYSPRNYSNPRIRPFLHYAGKYWLDHAQIADASESLDVELIKGFIWSRPENYQNWSDFYKRSRYWGRGQSPRLDPIWMTHEKNMPQLIGSMIKERDKRNIPDFDVQVLRAAAHYGRVRPVQLLIENRVNFDPQSDEYAKALYTATSRGHMEVVQLLIENGVNVNAQGDEYGNILGIAVDCGYEKIVQLLVENGADVNIQGSNHANVLKAAVYNNHEEIVRLLIKGRVDINAEGSRNDTNAQGDEYGNALQTATYFGYERIVQLLVESGADVNAQGGECGSALQTAAYFGHEKILQLLIKNRADVNVQGGKYGNALRIAVERSHEKILQLLIKNGGNANAQGGGDLLLDAAYHGREKIVQLLFEGGVDVNSGGSGKGINAEGDVYRNALQAAAYSGHEKIVQLLIRNGVHVNAQGGKYGSALQAAVYSKQERIIKLLVENGADTNVQGGEYGSALQIAVDRGYEKIVLHLVENRAEVNTQGGEYGNALQAAVHHGHEGIVQLLIENGADINTQSSKYGNALQAAVYNGHESIAQLLIENGADINDQNSRCMDTLQVAVTKSLEFVQLLVENGADVNYQGGEYGNALQAAAYFGHKNIIQFLIEGGAEINAQGGKYGNALQAAACKGHENIVQFLIESGADASSPQGKEYGNTLHNAASSGHEKIVQLLIEGGADINAQGGKYGNALQAAACKSHEKIVQLLIEGGADTNAQGGEYGNALQAAACRGHEKIVQLLIEGGADTNAQGGEYGNALQAAASSGHEKIFQLLIEGGADINAQGGFYGNALQAAAYRGRKEIMQLLIEKGANINAQGGEYGNALQAAVTSNLETVQLLVKNGADINAQGGKYGNALLAARSWRKSDIVEFLIENGAQDNTEDTQPAP